MGGLRARGVLALLVGWVLTALSAMLLLEYQDAQIQAAFQRDTDKLASDTSARLQAYFDGLLSLKGLFASNDSTSRVQFNRFVHELQLDQRYPGFQAIQFVRAVPEAQIDSYASAIRRDHSLDAAGYPNYKIHPQQSRAEHYVIEFTEPMRGNENAFGLDLAALPPHKRAVEMARDTGQVIVTERITLVQDVTQASGFVARAPVYRPGAPLTALEQRRAAFVGLVAIVFKVKNLISEVIAPGLDRHISLRIHDAGNVSDGANAGAAPDTIMYETTGAGRALPGLVREVRVNVAQRVWVMRFAAQEGSRYARDYRNVAILSLSGMVISALIAALLMSSSRNRGLAARLRISLDEQRAIQDAASIGIVLVEHGAVVRCNHGFEEILGYGSGELHGQPVTRLIVQPDSMLAEGARHWEGEIELRRKDGTVLSCMVAGRPMRHQRLEKAGVWVVQDVSARKAAEAALRQVQSNLVQSEKMASLGSLVAGVAHELNTPIGNSLLTASALADRFHEFEEQVRGPGITKSTLLRMVEDTRHGCGIVVSSLRKAADLIASFKQVAVDQTTDVRRAFNLADVLRDTLATHNVQMRRAGIVTEVQVPAAVAMDSYPGSIGQVVSNLINNALLHGFEGRGNGHIRITVTEPDEDHVQIDFADDGVGMSQKTVAQIFNPFFTTKMGRGGSGLGMNIVYNIVTSMLGGRIDVSSEQGVGTTIRITLMRNAPRRDGEDPSLPA